MELNKIYCMDAIEGLKQLADNSVDLIVTDPPYALGSEVIIRPDGKPDYSKAVDFMQKWSQPDGNFWEEWFKEAFRVLKFGGRIAMFGMDRQLLVNKYYSVVAGFEEQQSLYWYFISSFPKSADLSKNIDKIGGNSLKWFIDYIIDFANKKGLKRKDLTALFPSKNGKQTGWLYNKVSGQQSLTIEQYNKIRDFLELPFNTLEEVKREIIGKGNAGLTKGNICVFSGETEFDITTPSTPLAKKYEGYKYSISPLKQTCETIMIFLKPQKTGSTLHDTLAMENGDDTITCSALDIDGNRVPTNEDLSVERDGSKLDTREQGWGFKRMSRGNEGRYPSQTFIDEETAKILDKQSGLSISTGGRIGNKGSALNMMGTNYEKGDAGFGDIAGCSKILHKCKYDKEDFDLFFYCPKVDSSERNQCMEGEEWKENPTMREDKWTKEHLARFHTIQQNNHPTVKPLSLMTHILKLFKTPNKQLIVDTFAGSGSTLISAKHLGFDWLGFEINEDYVKIAKKRMSQSTIFDFQEDKNEM